MSKSSGDPRTSAQASVLKAWGQEWRRLHGKTQQDLGRAAGYGSDASSTSAAVAISKIEAGTTNPRGDHRRQLLRTLGKTEEDLTEAIAEQQAATASARATVESHNSEIQDAVLLLEERATQQIELSNQTYQLVYDGFVSQLLRIAIAIDPEVLTNHPHLTSGDSSESNLAADLRNLRADSQRASTDTPAEVGQNSRQALSATEQLVTQTATMAMMTSYGLMLGRLMGRTGATTLGSAAAMSGAAGIGGAFGSIVSLWLRRSRVQHDNTVPSETSDAIRRRVDHARNAFERAKRLDDARQIVLQRAGYLGRQLLTQYFPNELVNMGGESTTDSSASKYTRSQVTAAAIGLSLVSMIQRIQAIPVWLEVNASSQGDEPEMSARIEEEVRREAEHQLEMARATLMNVEKSLQALRAAEA